MNKIFYRKDNKYMNTNFISSFEDIKKYKHHYFTELCMTRENSFTLFNYGPYIANHMPDAYLEYPDNKSTLSFNNDLFRLMYECALMIKASKPEITFKNAKEQYLRIIERNNSNPYRYSNQSISVSKIIINSMREDQFNNNTLESAILNYSPIVQYAGTIVKPEMEKHEFLEDIDIDDLSRNMIDHLVQYIIPIMLNDDKFINTDDMCKNIENGDDSIIPYDYIKLANKNDVVSIYYTMVFLRYIGLNKDFNISKDDLINLNKHYNKIIKGDIVNMNEVIESFTKLSSTF